MSKKSKFIYFILSLSVLLITNFYCTNRILLSIKNENQYANNLFKITYTQNTGAAFSILENATPVLIIISIIAVCAMLFFFYKNIESLSAKTIFCLNILLSGIIGNLYERISLGYVRDYFDLTFIDFPIFNVSDVFINIGVFAIITIILFSKKQIKIL